MEVPIIAFSLLGLIYLVRWLIRNSIARQEAKINCSECLAVIPREAKKCMHCGSSVL